MVAAVAVVAVDSAAAEATVEAATLGVVAVLDLAKMDVEVQAEPVNVAAAAPAWLAATASPAVAAVVVVPELVEHVDAVGAVVVRVVVVQVVAVRVGVVRAVVRPEVVPLPAVLGVPRAVGRLVVQEDLLAVVAQTAVAYVLVAAVVSATVEQVVVQDAAAWDALAVRAVVAVAVVAVSLLAAVAVGLAATAAAAVVATAEAAVPVWLAAPKIHLPVAVVVEFAMAEVALPMRPCKR